MKLSRAISITAALLAASVIEAQAGIVIKQSSFQGLKSIVMESRSVKLEVLPERGANIISIYDKKTKHEWAWHNEQVKYRVPKFDDTFSDYDMSGSDDCFPTIGWEKCFAYPWKDVVMADHGELWSQPWDYKVKDGSLILSVHGVRFPYVFEKKISIDDAHRTVSLQYKVTNQCHMPMPAVWAGHYITAINPGAMAFYPKDTRFAGDLGPWALDRRDNLAWMKFGGYDTKVATKFYTRDLSAGYAGFYDPKTKDYLLYAFNTKEMPRIGLWINQCGYPAGTKAYHAGIEPTNGAETPFGAKENGTLRYIKGKSTMSWRINISFGRADRTKLYDEIKRVTVNK